MVDDDENRAPGNDGVYKLFPTYYTTLIVKTLANFAILVVAVKHYGGWRKHNEFVSELMLKSKAEAVSPYGFQI